MLKLYEKKLNSLDNFIVDCWCLLFIYSLSDDAVSTADLVASSGRVLVTDELE